MDKIVDRFKVLKNKKFIYEGRVIDEFQYYGSYPDMDKIVDSDKVEDRIRMASIGYGVDKLKDDADPRVRLAVAKGDYYPQQFIKDSSSLVRQEALKRING